MAACPLVRSPGRSPGHAVIVWLNLRKGIRMAGLVWKSLDTPEETRPFEEGMGMVELVNL
jgi:hypothetical protein